MELKQNQSKFISNMFNFVDATYIINKVLYKTKGIILNTINYSEKYNLIRILTESFGVVTYLTAKSKAKKTKVPKSLFFPLSIVNLEVEHIINRDIQRIKEAHQDFFGRGINTNLEKISIAFFLSEFLTKILRDADDTHILFDFVHQSIKILEMTTNSVANFHIVFILKLTNIIGFYPNFSTYFNNSIFNMIDGVFTTKVPMHKHYIGSTETRSLFLLSRITYENMHKYTFNRNERGKITSRLIEYYRLHLYEFPTLKTLQVLHELF